MGQRYFDLGYTERNDSLIDSWTVPLCDHFSLETDVDRKSFRQRCRLDLKVHCEFHFREFTAKFSVVFTAQFIADFTAEFTAGITAELSAVFTARFPAAFTAKLSVMFTAHFIAHFSAQFSAEFTPKDTNRFRKSLADSSYHATLRTVCRWPRRPGDHTKQLLDSRQVWSNLLVVVHRTRLTRQWVTGRVSVKPADINGW